MSFSELRTENEKALAGSVHKKGSFQIEDGQEGFVIN
jgi:hypothetical protein